MTLAEHQAFLDKTRGDLQAMRARVAQLGVAVERYHEDRACEAFATLFETRHRRRAVRFSAPRPTFVMRVPPRA